jgi:hypothetical protein
MRSVRCDACGTKALMAASKCPKCRNPIAIRDGFGELLKLAHCASCDSYYPDALGSCKWCGTRPERAPVTPLIWKAFGVLAFVAMAWGAWLVHDDPSEEVQAARMKALLKPDSSSIAVTDSATRTTTFVSESGNVVVDTTAIPTSVVAAVDSIAQLIRNDSLGDTAVGHVTAPVEQVALADTPAASEPELEPVPEPMPVERPRESRRSVVSSPPPLATRSVDRRPSPSPTRVVESTPRRVESTPRRSVEKPARRVTKKATPKPPARVVATSKAPARTLAKSPAPSAAKAPARKSSARWVSSVSRNWVIVRASASPGARIIASVGPNTRVQLGESRGGWRRIKAKGLAGWVEHRLYFAGAGTLRGSRLAARLASSS